MDKYAAFFRNLNLGRSNYPDRQGFEAAFLEAGAPHAASFLTNGTLVFEARSPAHARTVLGRPATTRVWNTVVRLVAKHAGA
jgi:uncharacterized protein (DUF1697 family)